MKRNPSFVFKVFLAMGDILAIIVSFLTAYYFRIYFDSRPFYFAVDAREFLKSILIMIPMWFIVLAMLGVYRRSVYLYRSKMYGRLLVASVLSVAVIISYEFFFKAEECEFELQKDTSEAQTTASISAANNIIPLSSPNIIPLGGGGWFNRDSPEDDGLGNIQSLEDIAHFVNLISLDIRLNDLKILGPVAKLPNLRDLSVWDCTNIDLSAYIDGIPTLKNLLLGDNNLKTTDLFSNLPLLEEYWMRDSTVEIVAASNLPSLTLLWAEYSSVTTVGPFEDTSSLNSLQIVSIGDFLNSWPSSASKITQIDLSGVPNLTVLSIGNFCDIPSLDFLKDTTKLTSLELILGENIKDFTPLSSASLEKLNISNLKASDLSFLSNMPELTELSISTLGNGSTTKNPTDKFDYEHIDIPSLTSLRVLNYDISDLSFLGKFPNLTFAEIRTIYTNDFTPLIQHENVENITKIDIYVPEGTDRSALEKELKESIEGSVDVGWS